MQNTGGRSEEELKCLDMVMQGQAIEDGKNIFTKLVLKMCRYSIEEIEHLQLRFKKKIFAEIIAAMY